MGKGFGILVSVMLALGGCAAPVESDIVGEDGVCSGKCDGLWSDIRGIDTGDLVNLGAGYATDEINDALSIDYFGVELDEPELFALERDLDDNRFESLQNINSLNTGLARHFGEEELTSHVNAVRQRHLETSDDVVYGESAFRFEADLTHGWSMDVDGIEENAVTRIGFGQGSLEGRVISAYDHELEANGRALLDATRSARGFVLPRTADEVRAMKPGETFALRGDGWIGLNVAAGVPILLAEPASNITYNIVISAALRAQLEGTLDIQMVRLEGNEVIIDVGSERATLKSARIAAEDGWGVNGLVESHVTIGGFNVDVGRLVERALEKQLNRKFNLIGAELERTRRTSRISVARFRFDLGTASNDLEHALGQAMRGDIRFAQLLAQQGQQTGVSQDFDLLRSGVATVSHAGIDLFGMSFFNRTVTSEGAAAIETPASRQTVLFDSHENLRGGFFAKHGFTRVNLSGTTVDLRDGSVTGEANLFAQVVEGDKWMQRDKLADHFDALIVATAGYEAFQTLETAGNALQRRVQGGCEQDAFNPCYDSIIGEVSEDRQAALTAFENGLPSHVQGDMRNLMVELAAYRLTAQVAYEPGAALVGPNTTVFVDARFSDAALEAMFRNTTPEQFRQAAVNYLYTESVDRDDTVAEIASTRAAVLARETGDLDSMTNRYTRARNDYISLLDAEKLRVTGLGEVGESALAIVLPVNDGVLNYDAATARSISESRADIATGLFDQLMDKADDMRGVMPEQMAMYTMLAVTPSNLCDVRVDIDIELDDRWSQDLSQYREAGYHALDIYAQGDDVELIGAGVFDVQAIIDIDDLPAD